jgi:hypothetical protein
MTRVILDDAKVKDRSALRFLLLDSNTDVVGDEAYFSNMFTKAPVGRTELILVDQVPHLNSYPAVLLELQKACPAALVIVLPIHSEARQQAALCTCGEMFIHRCETLVRAAENL